MIATAQLTLSQPQSRVASSLSMGGLVGVYFGLRVCLVFLFFRTDPPLGAQVGFALNLLMLVPVAFYAAGPASRALQAGWRAWPFRLVFAYLGLSLVSLTWSETSSRAIAFGYWTAMAADVVLVLLLLHAEPAAHATESLLKGFVCGATLLACVAWLSPAMADLRLGDIEFLNPNAIGFECALAALLCQHFASQRARWKWLGAALVITLVRSLSKTSIVAFLMVEFFYLFRNRTVSRGTKLAILFAGVLLIAAFWSLLSAYYVVYTNAGDQAETLTGRLGIWIVTIGLALERPWLGHGMHSFRAVVPPFGAFEPWHAHNEIIQQFFAYGILGVALVTALYSSLWRQARRRASGPLALLTRSLLLLVLIRGLADTERFDLSFPLWAITSLSITLAQTQGELA